MVLGIAKDDVAGPGQGRDGGQVGGEAGGKQERRLGALELRQPLFQPLLRAECPVISGLAPLPRPSDWMAAVAAAARRGSAARAR